MAAVYPYHTNSIDYPPDHRDVYHDKENCPNGSRIKEEDRLQGAGFKKRCKECDKVD